MMYRGHVASELFKMTPEQAEALLILAMRTKRITETVGRAYYDSINDCVMVPFAGMLVGIERDGYVHS